MTTATRARQPRPKPADTCRLTLTIRGVLYAVRPLAVEDEDVSRAFSLRRADGASYTLADTVFGATCDCGDQTWRHEGKDATGCKHIRAARAVGLLPGDVAPAPQAGAGSWPAWTDAETFTTAD
jgi:hypothetical protein